MLTQERPQLRPPRDADFQIWERRGSDYVLVCRRCTLMVGLYASRKRWDHLQKWEESMFADRLRDLRDLTRNAWKKQNAE